MNTPWPSFLVNVDFCGTCHGSCKGCLLDEDERKIIGAFLSFAQIETAFQNLQRKAPLSLGAEYAALAFGRGNTLALGDADWGTVKKSANLFQSMFQPQSLTVECSTGLVGKINPLIDAAKLRIDAWGDSLRFVVAANSDLYSQSYWDNVDLFFESLMHHRGGNSKDGSGDVLVLNLVADRLPSVHHLVSRLKRYPFPVNIAWLPLSKASTPAAHLLAHQWLNDFYESMEAGGWDSNFARFFRAREEKPTEDVMPLALERLGVNLQRFWWIEKNGSLAPGLFTPLGDVDFSRLERKLSLIPLPRTPARIFRALQKRSSCVGCKNQSFCIDSGVALHAISSAPTAHCPLGIRSLPPDLRH